MELETEKKGGGKIKRREFSSLDLLRTAGATGGKSSAAEGPDTKKGQRRVTAPIGSTTSGRSQENGLQLCAVSLTTSPTQPRSDGPGVKGKSKDCNKSDKTTPTIKIDEPPITQPSRNDQAASSNMSPKNTKQTSSSLSTSELGESSNLDTQKEGDAGGQVPSRNSDPPSSEDKSTNTPPEPTGSVFDATQHQFHNTE